jgi:uncharacterized membrane protein YphA (DoxX/SURF4 family)
VVFGIDAAMKWLPGYRDSYIDHLKTAASGQPSWLHGWFDFWITLQSSVPAFFWLCTAVTETALALVLLLGIGRRVGYTVGAFYMLLVWGVGEGFGGPYASGATDLGTGIVYTLLFVTLLTFAPPARRDRLSLDRVLIARWPWWRVLAEPHAVDRVKGAPRVEPVIVGTQEPGRPGYAAPAGPPAPVHAYLSGDIPAQRSAAAWETGPAAHRGTGTLTGRAFIRDIGRRRPTGDRRVPVMVSCLSRVPGRGGGTPCDCCLHVALSSV